MIQKLKQLRAKYKGKMDRQGGNSGNTYNRGGMERRYVNVSEILPAQRNVSSAGTYYQSALNKYREQYRRGKEGAWFALPVLMGDERSDHFLVHDGQHRVMAAILEGATRILCDITG